jgi:hypothetical protein
VAIILSLPLLAMLITNEVVWSLADFAVAGVLLAAIGVALELAVRKAGNLVTAIGIGAVGVAAAGWGKADDAPGLVLRACCSSSARVPSGLRTARRPSRAGSRRV